MKLLLISSSPRKAKSHTFLLAKEVLRGCNIKKTESEIIHLCDLKIEFCHHCEACHKKILACSIRDDVNWVLKKMLDADGIILASPNYINQVSGSMKTFFDRSSHFIHCKRLLDKYVTGVVSSGSGQDKNVLDYIEYYAHTCGAQYSGGVSSAAYAVKDKLEDAYQLGKKLVQDIKEKRVFADQMKIIKAGREHFKRIMQSRKDDWKKEYEFWQDKGWL
ncbi:MAG: flavodoxin family protein [candidate division Zixibacteria bacterium]|nr:flavodoxin family protein [candidate division Zixibacteria bacterium]